MSDTVMRLKEVLTHTEIFAVKAIFDVLEEENEKIIVATRLSAEKNVAKSVMISALRLLHAVGAVKTESVGSKGTRVIVLNRDMLEAVAKL